MRIAIALALAGCAARPPVPGPDETLRAWVEAAERGDADAAYALLSKGQKERLTLEEIRRAFRENPDELREEAQSLRRLLGVQIPATAEVPTADGGVAVLVLEKGRWRVAGGVGHAESLRTPRQTVVALRRALQRRSYDAVMRLLARSSRATVEDEVRRLLESLEDPDALVIEIDGDRATIEYEPGHVLTLEREDGEWRVVDLN